MTKIAKSEKGFILKIEFNYDSFNRRLTITHMIMEISSSCHTNCSQKMKRNHKLSRWLARVSHRSHENTPKPDHTHFAFM